MEVDLQNLRKMLTAYAAELRNEIPVLSCYTDVVPRSDGLGGSPEVSADRAWRTCMEYPDRIFLNDCIRILRQFRDAPSAWTDLRGELRRSGFDWVAAELTERRETREKNINDLISEAEKLKEAEGDYRDWEQAAKKFNADTRKDVDFLHGIIYTYDSIAWKGAQLNRIELNSEISAANRIKELEGKSKGGRKGARIQKEERGEDKTRKAILNEVKTALDNRDKLYPNKQERLQEQSNNAIYRRISGRHMGENGKPIMTVDAIKKAIKRSNDEPRGKYKRAGKKRGKYDKSK